MEWLVAVIAFFAILGMGIALYERRRKRVVLAHDLGKPGPQTETDRATIRATHEIAGRTSIGDMPPN